MIAGEPALSAYAVPPETASVAIVGSYELGKGGWSGWHATPKVGLEDFPFESYQIHPPMKHTPQSKFNLLNLSCFVNQSFRW